MKNQWTPILIEMNNKARTISSWWTNGMAWVVIFAYPFLFVWLTQTKPWFWSRITPIPNLVLCFFIIILIGVCVSSRFATTLFGFYINLLRKIQSFYTRHPFWWCIGLVSVVTVLFWYFRIQRTDSGDILHFEHAAMQGKVFYVEHAPLETLVRSWIAYIAEQLPWVPLPLVFKWLSCVYGGFYFLLVFLLTRQLKTPYNIVTPLLLLLTPALSLFCGYQEVYGLPIMAQVGFLLCGWLYLEQKTSLLLVSLLFGGSIAVGFWNGIAAPGYLYLLWIAYKRHELKWYNLIEHFLYVISPIMISLALLAPFSNPFAGIITRLSEPSLLIPLNPEAQAKGYHLFSNEHIADWANETLLMVSIPLLLLLLRGVLSPLALPRRFVQPVFIYLFLVSFSAYCFGFFYYPVIGFPLDWDLYTFIFPSAALLGAVMMNDVATSKVWRKRIVFLIVLLAFITSTWVLQNALFWRYPFIATKIGPVISPIIPDFYYTRMQEAFEQKFETHLYWLGEQALKESPDKYREIMNYMDDWTIATIAKIPPEQFDYAGWARDIALRPGEPEMVYIIDRYGRVFRYDQNERIRWVFSPNELVDDVITAGDFLPDGSLVMLAKDGTIYKVPAETINQYQDEVVWQALAIERDFLPESPSQRKIPVHMVDLSIQPGTNHICVLDNFNRVWETESKTLLLEGEPSLNLVKALHFANQHPVTIDVNNRLSYEHTAVNFPFETSWFYPIIRDFVLTKDHQGIMLLDLNGKIHYFGATPIFEDVVSTGNIVDRYIRLSYIESNDQLALLDNRYRIVKASVDKGGITTREKIKTMLEQGNHIFAFNTLANLWKRGSHFSSIAYQLLDTDMLRKFEGLTLYRPEDAIRMYVDALPMREDFIILIDRWGRLIYESKGVLFLLDGSGLVNWPRNEVIDGTLADNRVMMLCENGQVWQYHHPQIFGQRHSQFDQTPSLWANLNDLKSRQEWIGIESTNQGKTILALSKTGILLEIDLEHPTRLIEYELPFDKPIYDFAHRSTEYGYQLAYTSKEGPARLYSNWRQETQTIDASNFGWPIVSDITFSVDSNIVLLDEFGVFHQYQPMFELSDKPYTVARDAIALRFFPNFDKAVWIRSNGDMRRLKLRE